MKKIKKLRDKLVMHPILMFCFLILIVVITSGLLTLFEVSATYNKVSYNGAYIEETVFPENLFSLSGIKFIFSSAVSNFASFTPLTTLLISLMGLGIMDKSGFLDSFFYIITKRTNKKVVTFILSLLCILLSISGDLSFIVMIPLSALLFKYAKRHPKAGVICAFGSLTTGIGINIFMSSIDSALLDYTLSASTIINENINISAYAYVLIMFIAAIILAVINTSVTERIIVPKLGHYELLEEKEDYLTKREKRALILSLGAGFIYIFIFIYNIIPFAPLGGNFIDYSQKYYIDKLFGYNTFFSQGFVFVVTLLFFILGLVYGISSKKLRNPKEVFESLSYSLDKIGKVLVLLFFASSFIFIYKKTNIGNIIVAAFASLINSSNFTGFPLVFLMLIISIVSTIFLPNSVSKWSILSASAVPSFMKAGLSPTFANLIFRAGECISYGLTPVMAYYVIYLAFMDIYSVNDNDGLFGNMKYILPYAGFSLAMWIVLIIIFYVTGMPLGINSYPGM